jgi:hypothetical protein
MDNTLGARAWEAGSLPWLRALQSATFEEPGVGYATCLFCGAESLKLSVSDLADDAGRLTVYCDNMDCEAREIEVLVTRDGGKASRRADVRALRAVDAGTATREEPAEPGPKLVVVPWNFDRDKEQDAADRRARRHDEAANRLCF